MRHAIHPQPPVRRAARADQRRAPGAHPSFELVRRWRACALRDDEASWARLVEAIEVFLNRQAMQLARSQQLFGLDGSAADDYVQEVYLRLVAHDRRVMKRTHFANDGQLKEFLRRILSNVVSDDARRQRRRGGESGLGLLSELDPGLASEICERRTPESIYCARQTLRHFQRDCQRVAAQTRNPRRSCQIYRQTLLARRGASEVGGEVGLSANAIHATVHRARRELRRRFGLVVARVDS